MAKKRYLLLIFFVFAILEPRSGVTHDNCETRIISYIDISKIQNPEWILDLSSANGRLFYFGAEHSDNLENQQFQDIDRYWAEIKPTIAYYEGPDRGISDTRKETIRQFGESGYVRFLAKTAAIQASRLNPPPDNYIRHLLSLFPPDQVSLYLFLGEAARLRERKDASLSDVETGVKALMEKSSGIPGATDLIRDIVSLEAAYKKYWKEPADWRQAPQRWFTPGDSSSTTGGIFTNEINRASSEFRDRYMVQVLSDSVLKGERVFAVVGRSHVPMQAPALRCLLQKDSTRVHVEIKSGILPDDSPSPGWLEAIKTRHDSEQITALAREKRPLSLQEQKWHNFIKAQIPKWSEKAPLLAIPFNVPFLDRIDLLVGNSGGDDAFTYSSTTICIDLSRWVESYGSPANPDRVNRILSHEYTHLLTKSWLRVQGGRIKQKTPFDLALWELFNEGLGNYRSLSEKWFPKNGRLPDEAEKVLRRLEPVFVERIGKLRSAAPDEARKLTQGLSSGPFRDKWGALPVALWLVLETNGDDAKLKTWIEAGPNGVLDLAYKHLSAPLRDSLKSQLGNLANDSKNLWP